MIREKHIFGGLPVQRRHPALRCGVAVVDVRDGRQVALFDFTGGCTEIFDVRFLPGVLRPMILNSDKDVAGQAVTAPGFSYWLRPSAVADQFGLRTRTLVEISQHTLSRILLCLIAFRCSVT